MAKSLRSARNRRLPEELTGAESFWEKYEVGAGDGNRTHVASLEGWNFTIKLHPLKGAAIARELYFGAVWCQSSQELHERDQRPCLAFLAVFSRIRALLQ